MIRRAGPDDVDALRAIATAAYQKYVPRIGQNPAPMTADYAQAVRDQQAWAAIQNGSIAGFAILDVRSLEEAVEHARKFALLVGSERVDVRRVIEVSDLQ